MFAHLRFDDGNAEAAGVADIVAARLHAGVEPERVLLLVRTLDDRWRDQLKPAFTERGLVIASTDWVDDALGDLRLRAGVALARLLGDPSDSLAWWALTERLTAGVGSAFTEYVYDRRKDAERWGAGLLRLRAEGFPGAGRAAGKVSATVDAVLRRLDELGEVSLAEGDERGGQVGCSTNWTERPGSKDSQPQALARRLAACSSWWVRASTSPTASPGC